MSDRLLRVAALREKLGGISRATLLRLAHRGDFPRAVVITAGPKGLHAWRESDVDAWIAARPTFSPSEVDVEDEPAGAEAR